MLNPDGKPLTFAEQKEVRLNKRLEQRIPMTMFTISVGTGELKTVRRATDWLNHLQFSPSDPGLIMFCHEGPWHKVDRIWTIRTDGARQWRGDGASTGLIAPSHDINPLQVRSILSSFLSYQRLSWAATLTFPPRNR